MTVPSSTRCSGPAALIGSASGPASGALERKLPAGSPEIAAA